MRESQELRRGLITRARRIGVAPMLVMALAPLVVMAVVLAVHRPEPTIREIRSTVSIAIPIPIPIPISIMQRDAPTSASVDLLGRMACPPPRTDAPIVTPHLDENVTGFALSPSNAGWIAAWNESHVFVSTDAGASFVRA